MYWESLASALRLLYSLKPNPKYDDNIEVCFNQNSCGLLTGLRLMVCTVCVQSLWIHLQWLQLSSVPLGCVLSYTLPFRNACLQCDQSAEQCSCTFTFMHNCLYNVSYASQLNYWGHVKAPGWMSKYQGSWKAHFLLGALFFITERMFYHFAPPHSAS